MKWLILIPLMSLSICVYANSKEKNEDDDSNVYLDSVHSYVSSNWSTANSSIDSFFATETFEDEISESYVRFNIITTMVEGEGIKYDFGLRFKTDFPNTTRNIQLVVKKESNDPADVDNEQDPGDVNPQDVAKTYENAEYSAAVRYTMKESLKWNIHTDTGMKADIPIDPFVKFRIRRGFIYNKWKTYIIQHFNYYRQDRLKESTNLEVHRKISDIFQATFNSSLSWTYRTDTFSIDHGLTLYQKGTNKRAYSYSVSTHAATEPTIFYDSYSARANVRQLAYKEWFFIQMDVGANFPKSEGFDMKKFVTLSLEAFF